MLVRVFAGFLAGAHAPQLISFPPRSGSLFALFVVLVVLLPWVRRRDLLLAGAGTGLFLVYNDTQGLGALDGPLNRSLILKFSRQFQAWGG